MKSQSTGIITPAYESGSLTRPSDLHRIERILFYHDMCVVLRECQRPSTFGELAVALRSRFGWRKDKAWMSRNLAMLEKETQSFRVANALQDTGKQPLLEKTPGKANVSMTDVGVRYFDHVRSFVHSFDQLRVVLLPEPPVVFGATTTIAFAYLPEIFQKSQWLKTHANTNVRIIEGEHYRLLEMLLRHELDFALAPTRPIPSSIKQLPLTSVGMSLIFRRPHATLDGMNGKTPSRTGLTQLLRGQTLFLLPPGVLPHLNLDRFLANLIDVRHVTITSQPHILTYVRQGLGVGIVSDKLIDASGNSDEFGKIDLSEHIPPLRTSIYVRSAWKKSLSKSCRDLIAGCRDVYR